MRRTISCLLALTLLFGACFGVMDAAQAATDYSTVRVRLSTGSVTNMTIPVSGNYFIQENGAAFSGGTLSVKLSGGKITVTHSKAGQLYSGSDVNIMREKMDPGAGYLRISTTHGTRSYLGHLRLRVSSGYIQAINTVPLAHYLYGVVAYEMNDNFPLEALKAQAVAAKCYVLANMSPTSHYDIGDTSSDQVYKGYESSYRNVINAVNATWNVGLYLGNSILCSYFAASNGGETILPSDAWSGTNRYQWDKAYDRREDPYDLRNPLSRAGQAYFPKAGDNDRNMSRAASNYIRTRAAEALASRGYVVTVTAVDSIRSVEATSSTVALLDTDIIWESSGTTGITNVTFAVNFSDIATNVMGVSSLRLYSIQEDGNGYLVTAGRYGHGVGLSQRGAEQMANEGWKYDKILDFYYPGASLKTMNVSEVADPVNDKAGATQQPSGSVDAVATAVTTGTVNMRSGPGTNYSKLGQIPKGTAVSVYAQGGGWSQVLYNGALVYVSDDYLQLTGTQAPTQQPETSVPGISGNTVVAYGEVTASTLNFRASAVSGAVLQKLTRGDKLDIYGYVENSTWYYANAKGQDGYVSAQYVKLTGTPADTGSTGSSGAVDTGTAVTPPAVSSDMAPAGSTAVTNHSEAYLHRNPAIVAKDILGRFPLGTSLTLQGSSGEFYLVSISGMTGYVHKNDLTITSSSGSSGSTGSTGTTGTSSLGETTGKVNFRKGPGTSYGSMGMLSKGTRLTIHGLSNGWYQVTVDGQDGYISASYVKVTQQGSSSGGTGGSSGSSSGSSSGTAAGSTATTIGTGQMTTSNVNFRKGPGTSYGSIGKLSKGTSLILHSESNGWYYVTANGQQGYVSGDYVKVTSTGSSGSPGSGSSSGTVTDVTTSVGTGTTVWTGQVVNEWVRLRSSANFDTQANIIGDYDVGTAVTITGRSGSWYKVQTPDGKTGFMHSDYVQVTGEITTYTAKATAKVNFRTAMSTSSSVIRTLAKGTAVTILGESGDWYKIQVGDQVGYAVKQYIG